MGQQNRAKPGSTSDTEKSPLTVKLTTATKRELARAAYWLRVTIVSIVEPLIVARIAELREKHNKGKAFGPTPNEEVTYDER